MKNGDYTIIYKGKVFRFPTEQEMREFLDERTGEEVDEV